MAGMTEAGLEIKRLGEVITDLKTDAVPIFQDLVPPGDNVDVGDSSTIGRLIGLVSPGYSDLWEAILQIYWAFDPNAASGIALDNLVMYGGLTRNSASATQATVLVWGDENTLIPNTAQVRSTDNNLYNVAIPVSLTKGQCNGFEISIPTVTDGTTYGFNLTLGSSSVVIQYTAGPSDTTTTVVDNLLSEVGLYSWLQGSREGSNLRVVSTNVFDYISFNTISSSTVVRKIRNRTEVVNTVTGRIPQSANTINSIATPILGWDSVNNPFDAVEGKDTESDEELRSRFRDSKFIRAQNITDSLYSAVLDVDGVVNCGVFENDTDVYDPVFDLTPHSFKVVVLGGNPNEIAEAIWKNIPTGIGALGNTSAQIIDAQGIARDVKFERPVSVQTYITMELKAETGQFPANGADLIRSSLITYFQNNFEIGDEVVYSRLYTPINSVPGHQVNSLFIGTSPSPTGTANIPIPYNGIASIMASDIVITVV